MRVWARDFAESIWFALAVFSFFLYGAIVAPKGSAIEVILAIWTVVTAFWTVLRVFATLEEVSSSSSPRRY
jgi:hypothetical protein